MTDSNTPWRQTDHAARYWSAKEGHVVQCHLSPRNCLLKDGQYGFCGVRKNIDGELRTLNYGKSVHATQEFVETEALFHFAPGAKILSMGNLGCMMSCTYCHNWRTSQAKFVRNEDVHVYTPESVVTLCLEKKIPIISWTYNDPVVWQEFVVDTARLARQYGILNLYKSAFYISPQAIDELIETMDVFSLSLKSMDAAFYKRLTGGTLEPVLNGIRQVARSGKHLEVSNLMVTDANDSEADARRLADWVLENCSAETPTHFVRFHPDYRYTHVGRTPIDRLARAREAAMEQGLKYVYMGNVFDQPGVHTYCPSCKTRVIVRYGMNTRLIGLNSDGTCRTCKTPMPFTALEVSFRNVVSEPPSVNRVEGSIDTHEWEGDILSLHVETFNRSTTSQRILIQRQYTSSDAFKGSESMRIEAGQSYRFAISRAGPEEMAVRVISENGLDTRLLNLLDRAHFPTKEMFALR